MISVAAVGDVLDINTWSSTPYHFYHAGKRSGVFHKPWRLDLTRFRRSRIAWNIKESLRGTGGGYQFSEAFLRKAERMIPSNDLSSAVITFNQLFPRSETVLRNGGKVYRYIDATLWDLMSEDSYAVSYDKNKKADIINREKENYQNSELVITMAGWVRKSLSTIYELPSEKVRTILPGANIDLPKMMPVVNKDWSNFILGFIGKDWERKGLPLVIEIAKSLKQLGIPAKVKVIGNCPNKYSEMDFVEYLGFIDKNNDTNTFIEAVQSCDLGCFFSESEAMGIAPLEFIRLGVPVTGFAHQGLEDTLIPDAAIRFEKGEGLEAVCQKLKEVYNNTEKLSRLRNGAVRNSEFVTWDRCVDEFKELIS